MTANLIKNYHHCVVRLVFFAVCALSIAIPMFSKSKGTASVYHPRLFPFYYQTNSDAPEELRASLYFPSYFRQNSYRVNRPLMAAAVATVREFLLWPAIRLILPEKYQLVEWEGTSAARVLLTYFLWILANALLVGLAARLLLVVLSYHFPGDISAGVVLLFITSPIVILSLREIHTGALSLFIIAFSLWFWNKTIFGLISPAKAALWALFFGLLMLGKPAASTFIAGSLSALKSPVRKRVPFFILLALLPTVFWILILRVLDIRYNIPEYESYGAFSWLSRLQSPGLFLKQIFIFPGLWINVLWENLTFAHFVLFVAGVFTAFFAHRRGLLAVAAVFLVVDAGFYFCVSRFNAIYGMHTLPFVFIFICLAFFNLSGLLYRSSYPDETSPLRFYALILALLLMQTALNIFQLPVYGG